MCDANTRFAAVLFDMDGVLIDSNAVIEKAWHEAAGMYGKKISEEEMVKHIHGQPGPHTIQTLFNDLSLDDQKRVQAHIIHVENTAIYDPIPGVAQLISSLDDAGISVGIVTSGWREKIDRVAAMLQVQHCISVIVERDDVSKGKPFPDPYLLAAERLAIPAEKTIVFEDSKSGVTSAVAAGAYCVGIGGMELIECGAKLAIPDFTGIEVIPRMDGNAAISFCPGHVLVMEKLTVLLSKPK
ncbi:HAD family phosphatase [Nissabacter sp. SGAir0207]|uniref:HAD family hydrolase n=1 Tax=Nissabacter sp. SGAir0207 TaxID=2126321 RepID=UPI0010CCB6D6|nr:HAD family phosphatase [Nissabacter sp. SGAir0207]QCR35607.1 HAD family phosphatase [Nissabacter sp. SGAir0207]